jgi:hypothetical protein
MAFWSQAKIEPKRNFRWVATIPGLTGAGDLKFVLKKFKKPSFEIKATEHMYLNHKFNYPGRLTWKEIDFTLVNAAQQSTQDGFNFDTIKTFMNLIISAGYQDPSKVSPTSPLQTISKNGLTSGLGLITISQLGPDGNQIGIVQEKWTIYNPIITGVSMSDLDYSNEDINEVTVNLVYDYAKLDGAA